MELVIVSPSGILSQVSIEKITFPGEEGSFTVLPGHASLIAHLRSGVIDYTVTGQPSTQLVIQSGFVRVHEDQIDVCVELSETEKGEKV